MAGAENDWDIDLEDTMFGVGHITDLYDRAIGLTRREPLRSGNIVTLPAHGDAVVLGDLHGDRANFERVVEWAELHRHKDRFLIFQEVIHGGPADERGGDLSFRLVEEIAQLKIHFKSQVHMVLSNHDLAEICGAKIRKLGENISDAFREGIHNAYGPRSGRVHLAIRRFLAAQPLGIRTPNGVFISHSTPDADSLVDFDFSVFDRPVSNLDCAQGSSLYHLLWGRNHDEICADRFAKAMGARLLVTGHQTSMPGVKTPTSRHIVLTSDGPLGRVLLLPLDTEMPQGALTRQVMKIRLL